MRDSETHFSRMTKNETITTRYKSGSQKIIQATNAIMTY